MKTYSETGKLYYVAQNKLGGYTGLNSNKIDKTYLMYQCGQCTLARIISKCVIIITRGPKPQLNYALDLIVQKQIEI